MMAPATRRAALSLSAGLVALCASTATAVPVSAIANPDAELVALCGRFLSLERRQNRLQAMEMQAYAAGNTELEKRLEAAQRRYSDYWHAMRESIGRHQAQTLDGMRAKARTSLALVARDLEGEPLDQDLALWSLCRDLLGGDPGADA